MAAEGSVDGSVADKSVYSVSARSITSQLGTHLEVTNYAVKLAESGISQAIEYCQLLYPTPSPLLPIIQRLLNLGEMPYRWVELLNNVGGNQSIFPVSFPAHLPLSFSLLFLGHCTPALTSPTIDRSIVVLIVHQPPKADTIFGLASSHMDHYNDENDRELGKIMLLSHFYFYRFLTLKIQFAEEDAWTSPIMEFIAGIIDPKSGSTISTYVESSFAPSPSPRHHLAPRFPVSISSTHHCI